MWASASGIPLRLYERHAEVCGTPNSATNLVGVISSDDAESFLRIHGWSMRTTTGADKRPFAASARNNNGSDGAPVHWLARS